MFDVKGICLMNVSIVKMIIPALADFSKLATHYSSWLGLIRELLLPRAPNGSGGEFSVKYCLVG